MIESDKYTIRARLYPSFLVLLPVFVLSVYYITDFEKYYHYFTALVGVGLFSFLLSQVGRDKGKSKESYLHFYFGGKPTTQILRHENKYLNVITKERYHRLLGQIIPEIHIPTELEEKNNPSAADQVYDSCAKFLISKTRDATKFKLLFKENINYGFRRNLWGMKLWALILLLFCFVVHFYFATEKFTIFYNYETKDIGLFAFLVLTALFWLLVVNKNWIRMPAFVYAERLYETLTELA